MEDTSDCDEKSRVSGIANGSGVADLKIPTSGPVFEIGDGVHLYAYEDNIVGDVGCGELDTADTQNKVYNLLTPCPYCLDGVPSLTEYGLIALAAILVLSGVWVYRRRRALA